MRTRISNLAWASFFLLALLWPEGYGVAGLMSPPEEPRSPVTVRAIVFFVIVGIWFVSSIGSFYRSRLSWLGSLLGNGMATLFCTLLLVDNIRSCFFQTRWMFSI